jgi:hypothetical protein
MTVELLHHHATQILVIIMATVLTQWILIAVLALINSQVKPVRQSCAKMKIMIVAQTDVVT